MWYSMNEELKSSFSLEFTVLGVHREINEEFNVYNIMDGEF